MDFLSTPGAHGDAEQDGEITALLRQVGAGNGDAFERLVAITYREMRDRAHRQLSRARPGETLSTTALVHEAFLKLADSGRLSLRDRSHFYAVAARAMRQIIVDYARRASAKKRGGERRQALIDPADLAMPLRADELVMLDEALHDLARLSERLSLVVELRFFAGLSVEETAQLLDSSPRTVKRDWQKARAFLYEAIRPTPTA
jgi:RNA polymerase sigma factor (TIGR02999 family)